jgi:integrase
MPAANITTKTCLQKVTKQTKVYDARCSGFYVSVVPKGTATFAFKYWDGTKQASVKIGVYDPDHLTVEAARTVAFDLKARLGRGENIGATVKIERTSSGILVNRVIDEFIAYNRVLVVKADGEKRPRLESWKNLQGFLDREVRPIIGKMTAADVTNNDIARIQARAAKRSVSGARQTRSAMSRLFKFAAEAGRSYVSSSPVHNLPKLDKEYERTRVLNPDEIRTLWWGLDHPDLPATKSVALAIKFELVSMLRSAEIIPARRSSIVGLGTSTPVLRVPLKFVKKRRVIQQPLNSLAVEIINEATSWHDHDVIFTPRALDPEATLNRSALNQALNVKKRKHQREGIIAFLGMEHFTPHDLRRTASTLAGDIGFSDAQIAKCLDHSKERGEDVVEAPSVTGRVYVQSKRLDEKRAVLDGIDKALREIIGKRPTKLRLVA